MSVARPHNGEAAATIAGMDRLTVVIAAYNEAESLPLLQPRIAAQLDALAGVVDGRVLVSAEGSATADEMFAVIEQMDFDALKSF